jgi:hypothetical protein
MRRIPTAEIYFPAIRCGPVAARPERLITIPVQFACSHLTGLRTGGKIILRLPAMERFPVPKPLSRQGAFGAFQLDQPIGEPAMSIIRLLNLATLAAGVLAIGITSTSTVVRAQSLGDALERAEEGPGRRDSRDRDEPPPPPSGGRRDYRDDDPPPPPRTRRWGALAAALWRRNGVVQVAIGSAVKFDTERAARRAALRQCRGAGGRGCKVASTWSKGCGYITTGRHGDGAGWVARATYSQTMRDCRRKGYRCKKAIGGCVD